MTTSATNLDRYVAAQHAVYGTAIAELRSGTKQSHWMWFVLPQLRGLGRSYMADEYGLAGSQEARDYLAHPLLGTRLRECVDAVLTHCDREADEIFGEIDALKFRSCLTLFAAIAPDEPRFAAALQIFYAGRADELTLRLLAGTSA